MILSEKHELMRKLYRQFAETEFTPELLDELEETGEFNWDIHKKMAANGFMGCKIPTEYGGQGGDSLAYVLMLEEFAKSKPGTCYLCEYVQLSWSRSTVILWNTGAEGKICDTGCKGRENLSICLN